MHRYMYHKNELPAIFHEYFDENETVHDYNTRQKRDLHFYTVNSELGKKCIKHKGSRLWNQLPVNLKNIYSKTLFKKKLKELFLQSLK